MVKASTLHIVATSFLLAAGCAGPTPIVRSFVIEGETRSGIDPGRPFAFRPGLHDGVFVTSDNLVRYRPGYPLESLLANGREGILDVCFAQGGTLYVLSGDGLSVFYGGKLLRLDTPGAPSGRAATKDVDLSRPGSGLRARYFFRDISRLYRDTAGLGDEAFERVDAQVNFRDAPSFALPARSEHLTAVWTGFVRVDEAGSRTFSLEARNGDLEYDGCVLAIDGRDVLASNARREPHASLATIDLEAGLHRIRLEYRSVTAERSCRLEWSAPGTNDLEPVPADVLYPEAPEAAPPAGCLARDGTDRLWVAWETPEGDGRIALLDGAVLTPIARLATPVSAMASAPDGVFVVAGSTLARVAPGPEGDWQIVPLATVVGTRLVSVEADAAREILYVSSRTLTYALTDGALRPFLPLGGRVRCAEDWLYIASDAEREIVKVHHPEELMRRLADEGGLDVALAPLHGEGGPRRGISRRARKEVVSRHLDDLFEKLFKE